MVFSIASVNILLAPQATLCTTEWLWMLPRRPTTHSALYPSQAHRWGGSHNYVHYIIMTQPPLQYCFMSRFSTGLNILKQLLGEEGAGEGGERGEEGRQGIASCLPPSQLWSNLIAVACQHTSCERLKVIHLLIRLLGVMKERLAHDTHIPWVFMYPGSSLLEAPSPLLLLPISFVCVCVCAVLYRSVLTCPPSSLCGTSTLLSQMIMVGVYTHVAPLLYSHK